MTIDPHVIFPDVTNNECHLTPENPVRENREYVTDPLTGLRVTKRSENLEPVTSEVVAELLADFP